MIADRLRPNDTFIDVGANIGYFTLLAANRVGRTRRVISIEAASGTFGRLSDDVRRNAAGPNVRLIHATVTDREGTVTLHFGPGDNNGMASVLRTDNAGQEEGQAGPLSFFVSSTEMENVRLIKIDVEGAEALVIEGMKPILPVLLDCEILVEFILAWLRHNAPSTRLANLAASLGGFSR